MIIPCDWCEKETDTTELHLTESDGSLCQSCVEAHLHECHCGRWVRESDLEYADSQPDTGPHGCRFCARRGSDYFKLAMELARTAAQP